MLTGDHLSPGDLSAGGTHQHKPVRGRHFPKCVSCANLTLFYLLFKISHYYKSLFRGKCFLTIFGSSIVGKIKKAWWNVLKCGESAMIDTAVWRLARTISSSNRQQEVARRGIFSFEGIRDMWGFFLYTFWGFFLQPDRQEEKVSIVFIYVCTWMLKTKTFSLGQGMMAARPSTK